MNETWMMTKVKASIGGKQEERNKFFFDALYALFLLFIYFLINFILFLNFT